MYCSDIHANQIARADNGREDARGAADYVIAFSRREKIHVGGESGPAGRRLDYGLSPNERRQSFVILTRQ